MQIQIEKENKHSGSSAVLVVDEKPLNCKDCVKGGSRGLPCRKGGVPPSYRRPKTIYAFRRLVLCRTHAFLNSFTFLEIPSAKAGFFIVDVYYEIELECIAELLSN